MLRKYLVDCWVQFGSVEFHNNVLCESTKVKVAIQALPWFINIVECVNNEAVEIWENSGHLLNKENERTYRIDTNSVKMPYRLVFNQGWEGSWDPKPVKLSLHMRHKAWMEDITFVHQAMNWPLEDLFQPPLDSANKDAEVQINCSANYHHHQVLVQLNGRTQRWK